VLTLRVTPTATRLALAKGFTKSKSLILL